MRLVFFDSKKNAGFHMIGTIRKGRGKGIGNKITRKLIAEALHNNCKNCVLHASQLGENIYKRLGFISYGEIGTFSSSQKA